MNSDAIDQPQTRTCFFAGTKLITIMTKAKELLPEKYIGYRSKRSTATSLLNELCGSSAAAIGNIDKQYACLLANSEMQTFPAVKKSSKNIEKIADFFCLILICDNRFDFFHVLMRFVDAIFLEKNVSMRCNCHPC